MNVQAVNLYPLHERQDYLQTFRKLFANLFLNRFLNA